jgi:hypothetical protein
VSRSRSSRPGLALASAAALLALCVAGGSPAEAKKSRTTSSTTTIGHAYAFGSESGDDRRRFSYAVVHPGANASIAISDMGEMDDIDDLQREADRNHTGIFWFRLDGHSYRVTDRATVERAQEIVAPMIEIGREQGKYGAQMGEYGARMGEIGALQGRMGALRAQLAVRRSFDRRGRSEIASLERELDELSDELKETRLEQKEMARAQRELGAKQGKLGRKQNAATKRARVELLELAHRAIERGDAERDR